MNRKDVLKLISQISATFSSTKVDVPSEYAQDPNDSSEYIYGYMLGIAAIHSVGWNIPLNKEEAKDAERYNGEVPLTEFRIAIACGYLDAIKEAIKEKHRK